MLELIVVTAMVGILMVIFVPRLTRYSYNTKIDTVETELRTFALDINNYVVDYGPIVMSLKDSKDEGTYKTVAKELISKLNELYLGTTLDIDSIELGDTTEITTEGGPLQIYNHFKVKTKYKKDPWKNEYQLIFHTREYGKDENTQILGRGIVIVQSLGPNKNDGSHNYKHGQFGDFNRNGKIDEGNVSETDRKETDDIILIIQTKD